MAANMTRVHAALAFQSQRQEGNSSSAGSASSASAGSEAKAALAEVMPEVVLEVVPEVAKAVRMLVVQLPAWLLDEGSEALAVL